jgi:hypothetical protein
MFVLEWHAHLCVLSLSFSRSHIIRCRTQNLRTYIRSLIRDIGYEVDSCATTTFLERYVLFSVPQVGQPL